ncbi:MAG: hypothetical protein OES46_16150 [Gammaproteobacteria bacterium]|nr:hypothetical protein [Gammaproteobacteria bacterium]
MSKTKRQRPKSDVAATKPVSSHKAVTLAAESKAKERKRRIARGLLRSSLHAATFIDDYKGDYVSELAEELSAQIEKVGAGNLEDVEAMLFAQAHTLQVMFLNCACRMNRAKYLNQMQAHGQLALKAQNQCRTTLATLVDIKNPARATFIKNMATNQQVNLGAAPQKNSADSANKLLEAKAHERLDTRTPSEAVPVDSPLEALAAFDGTKDSGGQE